MRHTGQLFHNHTLDQILKQNNNYSICNNLGDRASIERMGLVPDKLLSDITAEAIMTGLIQSLAESEKEIMGFDDVIPKRMTDEPLSKKSFVAIALSGWANISLGDNT